MGARCLWWDSIEKAGGIQMPADAGGGFLPCCPFCRSPLLEFENEAAWWDGVDAYEHAGHVGYRELLIWSRGKCFKSMAHLQRAYREAHTKPTPGPGKAA